MFISAPLHGCIVDHKYQFAHFYCQFWPNYMHFTNQMACSYFLCYCLTFCFIFIFISNIGTLKENNFIINFFFRTLNQICLFVHRTPCVVSLTHTLPPGWSNNAAVHLPAVQCQRMRMMVIPFLTGQSNIR